MSETMTTPTEAHRRGFMEAIDAAVAMLRYHCDCKHADVPGLVSLLKDDPVFGYKAPADLALPQPSPAGGDARWPWLAHAIECCNAWEPEVRIIGNVPAKALGDMLRSLLASTPAPATEPLAKRIRDAAAAIEAVAKAMPLGYVFDSGPFVGRPTYDHAMSHARLLRALLGEGEPPPEFRLIVEPAPAPAPEDRQEAGPADDLCEDPRCWRHDEGPHMRSWCSRPSPSSTGSKEGGEPRRCGIDGCTKPEGHA